MYACVLSLLQIIATPFSAQNEAPFSMGFSQERKFVWVTIFYSIHWMYTDEENTAHGFLPSLSRQSNLYKVAYMVAYKVAFCPRE